MSSASAWGAPSPVLRWSLTSSLLHVPNGAWQVNIEHNGKHVKDTMTANCVRLLRTSPGQVNVKARTHEKLDSVGESRAVECHVVLTLEKQP